MLVPGNDLDGGFYDGLTAALRRRGVELTALALPGWAGVPPLAMPGWRALVAHVRAAVETTLTGGGTLIGHSLGALTALLVAAERPAGVQRLVLLEPVIAPFRALAAGLAKAYLRDVINLNERSFKNGNPLFRRVYDLGRYPRAAIERYEAVAAASDRATVVTLFRELPDLYPLPLGQVEVPALLVRGARSGVFPRLAQAGLARGLRRARTAVLARTGHWIANESDEAAAVAIAGFIEATGGPS